MPHTVGMDSDKKGNAISIMCSGEDEKPVIIIQYEQGDREKVIRLLLFDSITICS